MTPILLTLALTLQGLPDDVGLDRNDAVTMGGGISFLGAVLPDAAPLGADLDVSLYYATTNPLPQDTWSFIHLEAHGAPNCRAVQDRPPPAPVDGIVTLTQRVRLPDNPECQGVTLNLYTGLYDRRTGRRVEVVAPRSLDDRVLAASLELAAKDTPVAAPTAFLPSDMAGAELWARFSPWKGWLIGLVFCLVLAWLVARSSRGRDPADVAPAPITNRKVRVLVWGLLLGVPMVLTFLAALDFIKDDAYISFRYAHNVIAGHGLVFNPGEYVEGITNFLWTILMIPFEAMRWDLFIVSEWIGLGLTAAIILLVVRMTRTLTPWLHDLPSRWLALAWGGLFLGTSSSLGLWSHSGMEQALAMFLPLLSAWLLWSGEPADASPGLLTITAPRNKTALWSGVLAGLACATRPELHAIALCLGAPLVFDAIRHRRLPRYTLLWFAGLLAVLIPFHGFRYAYYGSLVPNTYYVKTGDSSLVWLAGLDKLHEMFGFNATGVLLLLAPFAFLKRERLVEKLVSLAIATGFMVFIVKVGVDEMHWHRLYLPALPFLVLLAAVGLINLVGVASAFFSGRAAAVPWALAWALVLVSAGTNFAFTYREMNGFNGRSDLSGNYHPDMGKFLTRHDRPGALVAFQDMGSTPYHAPDIDFLDFIGLVDSTVARARYDYKLHAFTTTEASRENQPKFDADMRAYFYKRNPEWTILTTYVPGGATAESVARRFAQDPHPRVLGDSLRRNGYQFGIVDERFEREYVHVRTWPRSATYYLSLYRRRDLWEKTPGEVVLDAVPPGIGGAKASFAGGLELLGAEVEPKTKQRYEAFITTWWRVPGPMPADTWFFFHIEAPNRRVPYDTLPGDFMYPADRWKPGQIIEHRTLFQVPPDLPAGTYKVFAGVYRRGSGERLAISTQHDGENRILLGELVIEPLNPPFDNLIKLTNIEEQRKYPERIIDHGRRRPE